MAEQQWDETEADAADETIVDDDGSDASTGTSKARGPRRSRTSKAPAIVLRVIAKYEELATAKADDVQLAAAVLDVDADPGSVTAGIFANAASEPVERLAALLEIRAESEAKVAVTVMGYEREDRRTTWRTMTGLGWVEGPIAGNDAAASLAIVAALTEHAGDRGRLVRLLELLRTH